MLWTAAALVTAGTLAVGACAVRPWARSRELAAELRAARAALEGRLAALRGGPRSADAPPVSANGQTRTYHRWRRWRRTERLERP